MTKFNNKDKNYDIDIVNVILSLIIINLFVDVILLSFAFNPTVLSIINKLTVAKLILYLIFTIRIKKAIFKKQLAIVVIASLVHPIATLSLVFLYETLLNIGISGTPPFILPPIFQILVIELQGLVIGLIGFMIGKVINIYVVKRKK